MTGTALALIAECRRIGVHLRVDGEHLKARPPEKITDDLRARLKAHALEVMAALRTAAPPEPAKMPDGELDRILLACGILPTPSPDQLPARWKANYETVVSRLVKLGVHRESAEAQALKETTDAMAAAGEPTGGA